jgi:hypothetical protein
VSEQADRRSAYLAFGLSLDVDPRIHIPGLVPVSTADHQRPRAVVKFDPQAMAQRWNDAQGVCRRVGELRARDQQLLTIDLYEGVGYLLCAAAFGRVLITPDGDELLCQPEPNRPDWAAILSAQALPFAATLRGLEVFHAAGVVSSAGAVLLAGPPGAGKSSLAAALVRAGAALLSDDVVALEHRGEDGVLIAHPGPGVLNLRPAEDARLSGAERALLGSSTEIAGKRRFVPHALAGSAPLAGLFMLERSSREPAIEHLDDISPFALIAANFNLSVRTPERLRRNLDIVARLAASGRVYLLRVQPDVDATRLAVILQEQLTSVVP